MIILPERTDDVERLGDGRHYIVHNHVGHNYIDHDYLGHNHTGHSRIPERTDDFERLGDGSHIHPLLRCREFLERNEVWRGLGLFRDSYTPIFNHILVIITNRS